MFCLTLFSLQVYSRMPSIQRGSHFHHKRFTQSLFVCLLTLHIRRTDAAEKIRYALDTECDRYSLDAVYYEKFKPSVSDIFQESQSFVNQVSDLVADSLTSVMAELPDRVQSSDEERKIFMQFKALKSAFGSRLRKIQRNITSSWESLIPDHFDLMFDNGKTSLQIYLNKTLIMTESHKQARRSLDTNMSSFVTFIKSTLRDGVQGIDAAANDAYRSEEAKKKKREEEENDNEETMRNDTKSDEDAKDQETEKEESKEDFLQRKRLEIAEMIVPGFLGKLTMEVIKRKLDLSEKAETSADERKSPLDDIIFDILMIGNRIRAIIQPDLPTDKGSVDLARRSIYTYWAGLASDMYQEKIREGKNEKKVGDEKREDAELADSVLNLLEKYP